MTLIRIETLIAELSDVDRQQVLRLLRDHYGLRIHPLESRWNTTAEAILEAIDRSGDLTQRGIRGVLAEATFRRVVLAQQLVRWREQSFVGEQSYDVLLDDGIGMVRV